MLPQAQATESAGWPDLDRDDLRNLLDTEIIQSAKFDGDLDPSGLAELLRDRADDLDREGWRVVEE